MKKVIMAEIIKNDENNNLTEIPLNDTDDSAKEYFNNNYPCTEFKTVCVIPIPIIKQKIQGIKAADQCDQTTVYSLRLLNALETVLDWYDSDDYSEYVERWFNNGE